MKISRLFCGCDCAAVKSFGEEQLNEAEVAANASSPHSGDGPAAAASSGSCCSSTLLQADALLLVFERLPDHELYSTVTAVSKCWQATAAAALSWRAITIHNISALSCKATSALAWLARYSSIRELHLHHAELHPAEWSTLLSLPFPKLTTLQLNRCRLGDCSELDLLAQMTTLQHLTLNHIVPQLTPGFVAQLGSSLMNLQSLELKSCGLAGQHMQGLTPLVQRGLCSLDLFDNPGIGGDVEGSNKALQMWAGTAAPPPAAAAAGADSGDDSSNSAEQAAAAFGAGLTGAVEAKDEEKEQGTAEQQQEPQASTAKADATAKGSSNQSQPQIEELQQRQQQDQEHPEQQQQQQQQKPAMLALRQLQLSYCGIRHLPQLLALTSLTSLNLQENKCDAETVQAVGQLQQLQQLVLEEAVGPATPPAAFAALAGLTNLELLDISGGPTGCLEELFGSATDGALPAATPHITQDTARAATAGWHGLRVKWSGRGRPPPGFRQPQQRRRSCSSASAGSSRCSSPGVTCGGDASACGSARCSLRSSLDMQAGPGVGPADAVVLLAPAPVAGAAAAATGMSEMEGAGKAAGGTAQAGMTELATDSDVALIARSGGAAEPSVGGITAVAEEESACVVSPLTCAGEACCDTGSASGCCGDEGGCGCSCSTLPRLRRLEAEQVGVSDACLSAIVACCSQLQDLDISHNHVGPDGIALLHALPGLTHLNISCQQPNLSDAAAAALVQLRQLKGLDLGGNSFSRPCEVQLQQQREGSGAGGKLVRLTGCGMRSELGEPWEQQHVVVPGKPSGGASKPGSPKKVQQQHAALQ